MQSQLKKTHVIIIGGGLSGLTAARQILKKQPSISVTVLQANDYLGGRTKSVMLNDCCFDLGAQFIGPSQQHVIELAHQSKNQLIKLSDKGKKIVDLKEGFGTYTGDIPTNVNILALIEMQLTIMKINRMAKKVPKDNPRNCPLAYRWDSMTAQSWIQQNLSSLKTKVMIQGALRVILGVDLSEISFLYMLYYIHQSRDFENLITVENGLQQQKTAKGTQHFSIFLGDQIKQKGGDIKLNFYVKQAFQNEQKVIVTSSTGQKIQGTYLIMAMPPPHVAKVHFNPPLSVQRRLFCQRSFMGTLAKILVLYPQAFWKHKGFTGEILSDCFDGPVMNVFDDTRVNAEGKEQPALVVFVGGGVYKYWKDRPNFQRSITQKLAQFFKEPKMLHPILIKWNAWQDQTSIGGAPVSNLPPGILTQIDDIRRPEGRIHWAGTELANVSTGFMDGAIQSGKRVAKQVLQRLTGGNQRQKQQNTLKQAENYPYSLYNRPPKLSLMNRIFEWW